MGQRERLAEKSLRGCMEVGAQEGKRGEVIREARVLCALVRSVSEFYRPWEGSEKL